MKAEDALNRVNPCSAPSRLRITDIRFTDIFGFQRLAEKRYTTAQTDSAWTVELWTDFRGWFLTAAPEEFRHLTWDQELAEARHREGQAPRAEVRL